MARWRLATTDLRGMGCVEDPEARLSELARGAGPLRRVGAALAERMVAARGWERLGYASVGDYARERLGVSGSSLSEWARVGARLGGLPRLEAALVSGALPWSKVRLLARFVTPEDEAPWIARAAALGVRALEREVRAVDRGALEAGGLEHDECGRVREATERVHLPGPIGLGLGWQRVRRYAEQVSGGSLSSAAVLEMVTAETLSALPLDAEAASELEKAEAEPLQAKDRRGEVEEVPMPSGDGAAGTELPAFLRSLVAGLDEAACFELDLRLRRVVRLEQRQDAAIGPLLRQVTASEYEWRGRHQTLAAYVRNRLGMSPRKARALLQLERACDGCPELKQAYRDGAVSWLRAQILAPLLAGDCAPDREWRSAWVAIAGSTTVRRLEEGVAEALQIRERDPEAWARLCHEPERLLHPSSGGAGTPDERQVCAQPMERGRGRGLTIHAPPEVARLFRATLCSVRRAEERKTGRLPTEWRAFEAMIAHALRAWGADDPWLRRWMRRISPVFARDGWRCTVPGCSSRKNLHAHHIVFRSAGGCDAAENLTTLCAFHHQRGVHAGRINVRGQAPDALTFELGLRPGQPPLERFQSGDRAAQSL